MSLAVDETAGDLPVRDVGLRGGPTSRIQDSPRDLRSWKKPQILKIKDHQRVFRASREQLEDQCLRLQEENTLLKQYTRTQEQKLRRLSTKLLRLRHGGASSAGARDAELEDTIQELEARVATLESQKEALQNKLSLARQHILDMGGRSIHRPRTGRGLDGEGGVRRAAQTAPPRYGLSSLEDTREETERLLSLRRSSVIETQQVHVTELELAAQSLRDTLREKEREIAESMKELRKQQADGHRLTIRDNVDVIRLQKQLSDKSAALLVTQEKFNMLQETYEAQLEESHRSMRESQGALLEKVEELNEQLKQEKERALALEGKLNAATLSLQGLEELRERVSYLEGEKNLLKQSYDALLESTLSAQSHQEKHGVKEKDTETLREQSLRLVIQQLEEELALERGNKEKLIRETERLRNRNEMAEGEGDREKDMVVSLREKHERLEQEVLRHRQEVTSLQERLDSVTNEFGMSVEELSETLLQIKAFRLQQESREKLRFLIDDGKVEESSREPAALQASHAETLLELQKTRDMLLLQQKLSNDLQTELRTVMDKAEREKEENRRRAGDKEILLKRKLQQINTLQAQVRELAYSPKNYNRTIPQQYPWVDEDQELVQTVEDNAIFSQLHAGESLLEIHLTGATFTPVGLRLMGRALADRGSTPVSHQRIVTFCTYAFLDFEMHSTPLISGAQPNYGFTSRYALSSHDLGKLGGQVSWVPAELHQALGGVRFVTRGQAQIPIVGAVEHKGERVSGKANIIGVDGEIIGVLEFWIRLYHPAEPMDTQAARTLDQTNRLTTHKALAWNNAGTGELFDYGRGIPNELEVVLERCVGLSARWPGLLPDVYLTYRLYDLPPHVTPTIPCSSDPVFDDITSYPLAVTVDVLEYLKVQCLWVYMFDDSEGNIQPAYLAKTPIPLRSLATGRPIRGDYVLRDSGGSPKGIVRVTLRWKYPFQPPEAPERHSSIEQPEKKEKTEGLQRPVAKPRVKPQPRPPSIRMQPAERTSHPQSPKRVLDTPLKTIGQGLATPLQSPARKRATTLRSPDRSLATSPLMLDPKLAKTTQSPQHQRKITRSPDSKRSSPIRSRSSPFASDSSLSERSSFSDSRVQEIKALEQEEEDLGEGEEEQEQEDKTGMDDSSLVSNESSISSGSDVIIIPKPSRPLKKGDKLRVEILSLSFDPTSHIAMNQSVQQVYVEYRLLGIPMETTETPMSLRKPTEGEEIHYNFSRVIYVDTVESAPLRQYLYTMLEGTDPNQGRLKFTVVSEPMNEQEECEDVGQAYLDLQELLLTGNDVIEQQIDILSIGENQEVVGKLKVSLEAAQALTRIYKEYHQPSRQERDENEDDQEGKNMKQDEVLHVIDYDIDDDFY
ncbi:protein fantom [Chanos chanos]|uniref:Protein fantom n=1 Tax=Chanos chanos TaxID=29144 RepID=A0A6J2VFC3_CHACN|nr:protein fantom-like [Chanos chanos]